jgi:small subunit ribosomal protein S21
LDGGVPKVSVFLQLTAMLLSAGTLSNIDVGSYLLVPSARELCISVRQWRERLGHRPINR